LKELSSSKHSNDSLLLFFKKSLLHCISPKKAVRQKFGEQTGFLSKGRYLKELSSTKTQKLFFGKVKYLSAYLPWRGKTKVRRPNMSFKQRKVFERNL